MDELRSVSLGAYTKQTELGVERRRWAATWQGPPPVLSALALPVLG